jgi:hypothetical protein
MDRRTKVCGEVRKMSYPELESFRRRYYPALDTYRRETEEYLRLYRGDRDKELYWKRVGMKRAALRRALEEE